MGGHSKGGMFKGDKMQGTCLPKEVYTDNGIKCNQVLSQKVWMIMAYWCLISAIDERDFTATSYMYIIMYQVHAQLIMTCINVSPFLCFP